MTRPTRRPADAVSVLGAGVLLLALVPAVHVIGGYGWLTPAMLVALGAAWLWTVTAGLGALDGARRPQPVRRALLFDALVVVVSYVAASLRASGGVETRAADRGLVVTLGCVGLGLLAADGIPTRARLDTLLRLVVVAGTVVATVGIVQFVFSYDPAGLLRLPGLGRIDLGYTTTIERSRFHRVAGTTLHPIEFSVVLTMVLPLALHYAFVLRRARWWVAVALVAAAIPMSVSRTASVALLALALVLLPTWPSAWRRQALLGAAALAAVLRFAVPGLLGTMRQILLSAGRDPSLTNRQRDYGYVWDLVQQHPWVGRGYATLLPERYDFLDNQYLLSIVETGVVGLVAIVAVFGCAIHVARAARRASTDPVERDLAQSLVGAMVVVLVAFATFDFLSFPTARGLAFLLAGCCGALWRLSRPDPRRASAFAGSGRA